MATVAPAVPAAPAAPQAPAAAPPAQPHLSPNEQIAAALTDAGSPPAPPAAPAADAQPAAQPAGGAPDPLEAVLAGLPPDHPAWARLQGLRTVEGRHRQTAAEAARAADLERVAEGLAVEAVLAGADPRAIGARYGIDPQALIEATGWQPGGAPATPAPAGAAATVPGQPAAQHPLAAAAAELEPLDFVRLYHTTMVQGAEPDAEGSWSKPYFAAMDQAAALRESADLALAEAYATEDPTQKALKTRAAETARAQARQAELAAMRSLEDRRASMVMRVYKNLDARLQQFERQQAEARQSEQAQQASLQAWATLGTQMRASRLEDGSAEFGPAGYGIFEVDEAGNCTTKTTPQGETALRLASRIMQERGWEPNMRSLADALDLLAMSLHTSDGGTTVPAGGAAGGGGDVTLPAGGVSPGGGSVRPSTQAQPNQAEQRMF